ncbi:MAG: phosphohistidine phosphatase [Flavobacteriaceae bacterium]|jgi:phosphohistidine phosphatase
MKLHLLRHAKTSPTSDSGKDIDRPLSVKGIAQSNLMGVYLQNRMDPTKTLCSSALRTRETLDIVGYQMLLTGISISDTFYLCSRDQFLQFLGELDGDDDLLVIGHNFGISDLATYLTDTRLELRTSEYICIEFKGLNWKELSRGTGSIVDQYRPRVFVP